MNIIIKIYFKIRLQLAGEHEKASVYHKFLGVNFGNNVRFTGTPDFGSEPYLVHIGSDVTITDGVKFHTHDGGVGILRKKYPGVDVFAPIIIGDNVFIGSNSTILPGVKIGNNIIIGASSLVTKDLANDGVYGGVPAKLIKTLAEYEEKIKSEGVYIKGSGEQKKEELLKTFLITKK